MVTYEHLKLSPLALKPPFMPMPILAGLPIFRRVTARKGTNDHGQKLARMGQYFYPILTVL